MIDLYRKLDSSGSQKLQHQPSRRHTQIKHRSPRM